MAIHSEIAAEGWLTMAPIGDHTLEEGFADCNRAMDLGRSEWQRTGNRLPIFMNMLESEEHKDPEELAVTGDYFRMHLDFLTGRMAFLFRQKVRYVMTRLLGSTNECKGLEAAPFYERDEAIAWLQRPWGTSKNSSHRQLDSHDR